MANKNRNRSFNISTTPTPSSDAGDSNQVDDMSTESTETPVPDNENNTHEDASEQSGETNVSDQPEESVSEGTDASVQLSEPAADQIADEIDELAEHLDVAPRDLNSIPVNAWTLEELNGYITGTLEGVQIYHSTVLKAIDEHLRREETLDRAWSLQEVREYLTQGIVPPKTSKGAWINDVTRSQRRESEWTTQELESWALGEIQAYGLATAPSLALELKRRLLIHTVGNSIAPQDVIQAYKHQSGATTVTTTAVGDIPTVATAEVSATAQTELAAQEQAAAAAITYKGLSAMNLAYIESVLAEYLAVCKPGKVTSPANGLKAQKSLDHLIRNYIIGLDDPAGIKSGLDIVLATIKKNRAKGMAFDDTHAFRFTGDLPVAQNIQASHIQLLTLFFIFADDDKEQRKQFDIASLVSLLPAKKQPFLLQYFTQYA